MRAKSSTFIIYSILFAIIVNGSMSLAVSTLAFDQTLIQEIQPVVKPTCHSEYSADDDLDEEQCDQDGLLCFQCIGYFAPEMARIYKKQQSSLIAVTSIQSALSKPNILYRPPKIAFS